MKAKDVKPGHYDEILDRTHCLRITTEATLVEHPCYTFNLDIQSLVNDINERLDALYQMAGRYSFDLEEAAKRKAKKMYRLRQRNKRSLKKAMKGEL